MNGSLAVDSYVKPIFNTFIRNYFNRLPPNEFFPVLSQKPDPLAESPLSRPDPSSTEIMSFVANRLRDMIVGEILSAEYEVVSNHKPPFRNMLEIFHIQVPEIIKSFPNKIEILTETKILRRKTTLVLIVTTWPELCISQFQIIKKFNFSG